MRTRWEAAAADATEGCPDNQGQPSRTEGLALT
jgi:hypothetical protein